MNKKRQLISLSDKELELIKQIAEDRCQSFQWVIHFAISEIIKKEKPKEKPAHVAVKEEANRIQAEKLEILKKTGTYPTARGMKKKDQATALCAAYGGKVEDGYCVYTQYNGSKDMPTIERHRISEERVPLSLFNEDYKQYPQGKEEYLAWCKEINVDPYQANIK